MRYRIYFGLTLLFTLLMIVISLTFEYYFSLGSFQWRIDVVFFLLAVITLVLGFIQFDLKTIEFGKKHHHKLILAILPIIMTYYVLSNILTREYDLPVLISLISLSLFTIFLVIYMFIVSYTIKEEDGLITSHIFKPKRVEVKYSKITSIKTNFFIGVVLKTEETTSFLHIALEGTLDVLTELSIHLDKDIYLNAFEKLAKSYKKLGMINNYNLVKSLLSDE